MEEVEDIENVLDQGTVERFGQRSIRRLVPERSTEYGGRVWERTDDKKCIKYCPWVVLNVDGS